MATQVVKTHVVTGDQYRICDRRMSEIKRQLDQKGGSPLDPNLVASALQNIIDNPWGRTTFANDDSVTLRQASAVMGSGFVGAEALQQHLRINLSSRSQKPFARVPYGIEVLKQCRATHNLVACAGLSLAEIWQAREDLFYLNTTPSFVNEPFGQFKPRPGYYLVRKSPVPGSPGKTYAEQTRLLKHNEIVPCASVLVQTILLTYLETEERLFETMFARTSDVRPDGGNLCPGEFDLDGIKVDYYADIAEYGYLGLASSVV